MNECLLNFKICSIDTLTKTSLKNCMPWSSIFINHHRPLKIIFPVKEGEICIHRFPLYTLYLYKMYEIVVRFNMIYRLYLSMLHVYF